MPEITQSTDFDKRAKASPKRKYGFSTNGVSITVHSKAFIKMNFNLHSHLTKKLTQGGS